MRKFLSGICLFNDTTLNVRNHFILNGKRGEECDIAERQRERERVCVCERQCVVEGGGSVSCKTVH